MLRIDITVHVCLRAVSTTYSQCVLSLDCRVPFPEPRPYLPIKGTIFPAASNPSNELLSGIMDGMVNVDGGRAVGNGVKTVAHAAPFITVDLLQVVPDHIGVAVWAYDNGVANTALGAGLSIWIHMAANFTTDPSAVMCARKVMARAIVGTFVQVGVWL